VKPTTFGLVLYATAVTVVAVVVTISTAFLPATSSTPDVDWIYGPKRVLTTGQPGVVVYCQGKTNAPAFANRERAEPGDVVIETCRAVKGGESS